MLLGNGYFSIDKSAIERCNTAKFVLYGVIIASKVKHTSYLTHSIHFFVVEVIYQLRQLSR